MNRRLLLIFLLVVCVGAARLVAYGLGRWRSHRAALSSNSSPTIPWTNPPAPQSPPSVPPPGRPFSDRGTVYASAPPTLDSLRAAVVGTNLVICVLDAARVDHFSAYGYPRLTTPSFDRLARAGLLFDQHFCQAPHTGPSTASLLSSQYPDTHGVLFGATPYSIELRGLGTSTFTLEKALQGIGYDTFLFSANVVASPRMGIGDDFVPAKPGTRGRSELAANPVASLAKCITEATSGPRAGAATRFFAYLHILPPHLPYLAPKPIADLFAKTRPARYWESGIEFPEILAGACGHEAAASWVAWGNSYDANLRWADTFVDELEETLKRTGVLEHTLLVVTADHGEALREHGYSQHAGVPYDEALHIPLLIRFPGANPPVGRVKALTQTVDLLPTLLDLYGVPYPQDQVQGNSLLPLLTGKTSKVNDYLFARATDRNTACYVVRDSRFTLLLYLGGKPQALYDMDSDPYQTRNLITAQPARAKELVKAFARFAKTQKYPPLNFVDRSYQPKDRGFSTMKMSEETKRRLKSLGYLK